MVIFRIVLSVYDFYVFMHISMYVTKHFSFYVIFIYISWYGIHISNDVYLFYTFVYLCVFIASYMNFCICKQWLNKDVQSMCYMAVLLVNYGISNTTVLEIP